MKWIRIAAIAALASILPAPPLLAGPDPAAELAALEAARDESELGYRQKAEEFLPRFEAFVEKYPGTEAALTAKLWLFQQTWWQREAGTMHEASGKLLDEILSGWPESKQLAMIPEYHYVIARDRKAAVYEKLMEISPHREVKAAALFGLARLGDGEARFRRLIEEFPDVPWRHTTYGEIAKAYLNVHPPAALEVGEVAPEIVGRDLDGNGMKLSDYRGRVVLLDFWGDW